ncbi:glycoside hydrolase family 5 protein [Plicaturopsis crispa FD-325 SS-3]|nr:glycoside hydrolase family 5 protein [Plicaturopsis crispa FD-325 SS-3]
MSDSGRNSGRFQTADAPTDGEALVGTTPPVPTHDPGASRFITPQETSPFEQSEKAEGYEGGGIASGYSGGLANDELQPPRASYLLPSEGSSPRDSYHPPSSNTSTAGLGVSGKETPPHGDDAGAYPTNDSLRRPFFRRPLVWLALVAAIIVIALAVVLPVVFVVVKPGQHNSSAAGEVPGTTGGGSDNPGSPTGATSGGNGSLIKTEDGSTFTYVNPFGGFWVADPKDPFNNNARPNSWTPPLNTTWDWGKDRVYGVNLGGLFVLEPFISPALFQKYPGTVDEWTLSEAMAADTASGGLNQLEDHYNTFITEKDIAEIAGAGLNWIRVPIPYWCIETWEGEPFLAKTSWKYILRLLGWARKYGLRVNLDLHTVPGSQNGYNHSGRLGLVNFLNGVMGLANAERTLGYIRIITEFISQPEYANVVPMFGIVNEALLQTIGREQLSGFYLQAHGMIRGITGIGEGHGPYISIHDGFMGTGSWANFLPGSDRIVLDTHPYFAFDGQPNNAPIVADEGDGSPGGVWPKQACNAWGPGQNTSKAAFGVTVAGEFSNGYNDCGLFLKGVQGTTSYGGDCSFWQDASQWNSTVKAGVQNFALASMDALQDFFFWTWKIGNSTSNIVESPLWSYQLGLENGWMPTDPRVSIGKCGALGVTGPQFNGTYDSWQTGGVGAGTIAASATAAFPYPPASLSGVDGGVAATALPSYASTGSVVTLPPPTLTVAASTGDGWFDTADTAGGVTVVAGCTYPDAWSAVGIPVPTVCGGGAAAAARAVITPAPPSKGGS